MQRLLSGWRSRQRGHLLFPVWTVVYWTTVSFLFINPYNCFLEVVSFVFSWLAPVIAVISLGQDGLAMMLLPLHIFFFIMYWKTILRFLRSGIKVALFTITLHMLGGCLIFSLYNVSEIRPDFGLAIAIIPPLSMFFYLVGYFILHKVLVKHSDIETKET